MINLVIHLLRITDISSDGVMLVEPVLKYLFLHPAPPPLISSLATQLHSDLTHLAMSSSSEGGCDEDRAESGVDLVRLLVSLLPLQPTHKDGELLSVVSYTSHLLYLLSPGAACPAVKSLGPAVTRGMSTN